MASTPMSLNGIQLFELPKEKTILWDHTASGSSVKVHFSQHQKPKVYLKIKVLQQALKCLEASKSDKTFCQIRGFVTSSTGSSSVGINISLDQLDNSKSKSLENGEVQATVALVRKTKDEFQWDMEQYFADLKEINVSCSAMHELDLAKFLKLRIMCDFRSIHCVVKMEVAAIATSFTVIPIKYIPVRPSDLSHTLCESKALRPCTGFLTMDHAKSVVLLSETEPELHRIPLVGIWVSGVTTARHPIVWAACVRYVSSMLYKKRLCLPPLPFLLAIYGPDTYLPIFHDCVCDSGNSWPMFACYEGISSVDIPKVPVLESKLLIIDLNRTTIGNSEFTEADKRIERSEIQTGPPVITSNTEDVPQLMYKPPEKLPVIADPTPLAPDLSFQSQGQWQSPPSANGTGKPINRVQYTEQFVTLNSHAKHFNPPATCMRNSGSDSANHATGNGNNPAFHQCHNHENTVPKSSVAASNRDLFCCQNSTEPRHQLYHPELVHSCNQDIHDGRSCKASQPSYQTEFSFQRARQLCKEFADTIHSAVPQCTGAPCVYTSHLNATNQLHEERFHHAPHDHRFPHEMAAEFRRFGNKHLSPVQHHATSNFSNSAVQSSIDQTFQSHQERCYPTERENSESIQLEESPSVSQSVLLSQPSHVSDDSSSEDVRSSSESATAAKPSLAPLKSSLKSTAVGKLATSKGAKAIVKKPVSFQASVRPKVKVLPKNKSSIPVRIKASSDVKNEKVDSMYFEIMEKSSTVLSNVCEKLTHVLQKLDTHSDLAATSHKTLAPSSQTEMLAKPIIQESSSVPARKSPRRSCSSSPQLHPSNGVRSPPVIESLEEETVSQEVINNTEPLAAEAPSFVARNASIIGEPVVDKVHTMTSGNSSLGSKSPNCGDRNSPKVNVSFGNFHSKCSSANYASFHKEMRSVPTMTSFISTKKIYREKGYNPAVPSARKMHDVGVSCNGLQSPLQVPHRNGPAAPRFSGLSCIPENHSQSSSANTGFKASLNLPSNHQTIFPDNPPIQVDLEDYPGSIDSYSDDSDQENFVPQAQYDPRKRNNGFQESDAHPRPHSRIMHHDRINARITENQVLKPQCCNTRTEHVSILQQSCIIRTTENCGHSKFGINENIALSHHYMTQHKSCKCCEQQPQNPYNLSDLTYYGISTPNLTIATKQYLHKYNLIPSEGELRNLLFQKNSTAAELIQSRTGNGNTIWVFDEHHRYPRHLDSDV